MKEREKIKKSIKANNIIKNHMIWSMGAGFIPVPIADVFAVSAIQIDMIRQLSKLYNIDFKETEGKAMITSLTTSGLAGLGARAFKFIPVVGTALGGATMAVLSGGSTYALGEVFKKHFETGGTFLDFDPDRVKDFYTEKFNKGKDIAKKMEEEKNNSQEDSVSSSNGESGLSQLQDLVKLKEAGVINDIEFDIMKKRIIGNE